MNKFENEQIKHQIYLEQYKSGQADKIIALIDQSDKKIAELLKKTKGIYTKNRYKEIAKKIKQISKSLRNAVENGTDIDGIIEYELKKQKKLLSAIKDDVIRFNGGKVDFIFPSLEQIKTSALFAPVTNGMTYQSYLDGIEYGLFNAWDSAVRTGYLTGQTTDDIVRGVLGGVSGNGKLADSGSIRSFRNSVYRSTRTVLQSFANETRSKVFEANEEYFGDGGNKYEYLATLDTRTCLVCGESDGKLFKSLKEAPKIPRHFCCRCLIIPYFDIDGQTRSSTDGYVSDKITFGKWLDTQDEKTQLDVLGRTRYELFRRGEKIDQFVDNGKILTLEQLDSKIDIRKVLNNNISKPDINNFAKHAKARLSERGVTVDDVYDAINNPLKTYEIRKDGTYKIIGKSATVGVSAYDGKIVTVWKTGKERLRKIKEQQNENSE